MNALATACPHCAAVHPAAAFRCPSTGLPIGGDPGLVGATLSGRYSVVRLLGDGGMGAVYKASDDKLRRFVAIKILHRHMARDPDLVERLVREARSAAGIGHPNIIDVLDFAEDRVGPLMVMEYLKGRSLAGLLEREGPLSVPRACSILAHMLAGLAAAHDRGILHRDLKPANLMLISRFGDRDFVKVCDFGFAAFLEPSRHAARDITPDKTLVGTPSYAAPERWLGEERRDPRTDIWSAGVILYEMLAGVKPFKADKISELARRVCFVPLPSVREHRGDVPVALEEVIARALAKEPEQRWQTAAAFAEALVPFGGRPVVREPDEPSEAFELDLIDIRARENRHRQASEALELSMSDALTAEVEESQVRARVFPRPPLVAPSPPSPAPGRTPVPGRTPPPPPVAAAPPERAFQGAVVLAVLRFLTGRFGDSAVRMVLEGLPDQAFEPFRAGIGVTTWVPYDAVRRLMEHIDRRLGSDDLRFIVECGRGIAEGVFERRRELEPTAPTPEQYVAALPQVGKHLVRGVDYVVRRLGPGHGRLELIEATESPSLTGCVATLGFIERSLVRAGARDVEVNLLGCRALGDQHCMFDMTWLSSADLRS